MNKPVNTERKQKIAVITGGSSGIGKAIAQKFAENGIFCILVGRNKERLEETAALMDPMAEPVVCDLSHLDGISTLVKNINQKYRRIDILVNSAGIHLKKPMTEVTNENSADYSDEPYRYLLREISIMKQKRQYRHISSMAAHYGLPGVIAYTAAKAGIKGITRAMAVELSPSDTR
jgi:NADP-dependent 3-hydroxy acid dehydrogenase YdfG